MGVAGGPVRFLIGDRRELTPVWREFGIVPIVNREEEAKKQEEPGQYGTSAPPVKRAPPAAASDPYPAADDGVFRGHPRHHAGADYEHSAYVLVIDKHGRARVGLSFELLTSELLLHDVRTLKAEL
jgi:hypothetical protein